MDTNQNARAEVFLMEKCLPLFSAEVFFMEKVSIPFYEKSPFDFWELHCAEVFMEKISIL